MSALLKRVLVVDDDPVVGKSFNRVLTQKGYVVVTAQNGHEALSKLQEGEYDCVFTDIKMPGMDGLELAEQVHARQSWTPVVIVTGFGSQANEARAKAAGVTAFMHKPLSPEQIEAAAAEAMAVEVVKPAPVIARAEIAKTIETVHAEVHGRQSNWKKVGLLLAAPVVSAAFVFIGPFVALAALLGMCFNAVAQRFVPAPVRRFVKNATLFFAAPFIGLAYILAMPVVGLATLAWLALRGKQNQPTTK